MVCDDYLVARVGALTFGVNCRDVRNVHTEKLRIVRLYYQSSIFRGLGNINGQLIKLIDLRRRIGMQDLPDTLKTSVITFQTNMEMLVGIVVDQVIGMKRVETQKMTAQAKNLNNAQHNTNLLFPMVATLGAGDMIHLLDPTYLEKTEPIKAEDCGDLELF